MDLFERSDEIKSATRALSHALKTRKDLDSHARGRVASLIERARTINNLTNDQTIQDLIRETSELNQLFTTRKFGQGSAQQGGTISGMETGQRGRESQLGPRDEQFVREFRRISSEAQSIAGHLRTATTEQARDLNRRLLELSREQDQVVQSRHPISRGEVVDHPAFAQAVRDGYARLNARGSVQFSPTFEQDAVDLARKGFENAGTPTANPFRRSNPLSSKHEKYKLLLNQGIIQRAYDAARRALLDERIARTRVNIASIPISPTVTPPVTPPQDATPTPAAGPVVPPNTPGTMQPGVTPPALPMSGQTQMPNNLQDALEEIRRLREEMRGGGNDQPWWVKYPAPPWMPQGPGGHYVPPQAPGVMPANTPAAVPHAPGHGHGHETPPTATPARPEATPQSEGGLWSKYSDLEEKQQVLNIELSKAPSVDRANAIRGELARLREQQLILCRAHIPHFDEIVAREVAKQGVERGLTTPTAGEAGAASEAVRAGNKDAVARFVAQRSETSPEMTRKWMSAFKKRWPWKIFNGMLNYGVGKSAFAAASYFGLGSMGPVSVPAMTLAGITVPAFAFSAPLIATVAGGVLGWQYLRSRMKFFSSRDKLADAGWEAKKLSNTLRKYAADPEREYRRFHNRWKIARMQTFVPGVLGILAGHGIANNATQLYQLGWDDYTKKKAADWERAKKLGEDAGVAIKSFWNSFSFSDLKKWFTGGEKIKTAPTPADCAATLDTVKTPAPTTDTVRTPVRPRILNPGAVPPDPTPPPVAETPRTPDGPPASPPAPEPRVAEAPPIAEPPRRPEIAGRPVQGVPVVPEFPTIRLKPEQLSFVINEGSDVKNIPQGLRRLFDSMQFKGKAAEWLIDTIDRTTYNGYGGRRGGEDVVQMLTGRRSFPTRILDNTTVNLKTLLTNPQATIWLDAAIERTNALTTFEKAEIRRVLNILESTARR